MFSGKTTEIIRQVRRQQYTEKSVLMVKYSKDTRYDDEHIVSHDQITINTVTITLDDISTLNTEQDVIGIDEGQFIKGLPEWADTLADSR